MKIKLTFLFVIYISESHILYVKKHILKWLSFVGINCLSIEMLEDVST